MTDIGVQPIEGGVVKTLAGEVDLRTPTGVAWLDDHGLDPANYALETVEVDGEPAWELRWQRADRHAVTTTSTEGASA